MSNRDEIDFKLILYVHNGFEMETSRRFYWYSCYPNPDLKDQLDKDLVGFLDSRDFQKRPLTVSERRTKYLMYSSAPDCETRTSFMVSIFAILLPKPSDIESLYSKIISQWSSTNSFMYYETFFKLPLLTYDRKLVHPIDFYEVPWINQWGGKHLIYYNAQVLNAEIFTVQIVTVEEIANDISLLHLLLIDDDPRLSTESLLTEKRLVNRSSQSESNPPMLNDVVTVTDDHLGMVFEDKEEIKLEIKEESKENIVVDESFTMTFEDFIKPKFEPDEKEPVEPSISAVGVNGDKKDLKPIIALQNEVGRLKKEILLLKAVNKELLSKSSK